MGSGLTIRTQDGCFTLMVSTCIRSPLKDPFPLEQKNARLSIGGRWRKELGEGVAHAVPLHDGAGRPAGDHLVVELGRG